jgi:hypothetical protein
MAKGKIFAEVTVGEHRLVVMREDFINDNIRALAETYAEVRHSLSFFGKFPMKDGEDMDAWALRVQEELDETNKKRDDESQAEYIKRVFHKTNSDRQVFVKEMLKGVAKVFNQEGKITDEGFEKANYLDCKEFLTNLFRSCDYNLPELE